MGVSSGIKKILKNPFYIVPFLNYFRFLNLMPDERFLKLLYRGNLGRWPDLKNPRLFTEKLQWLKLHDRKPEYTRMVDKFEARDYIAERLGEEYLIPLLGVWDRVDDIDFSTLPDQFVLKCTHDSGGVVICKDKGAFNMAAAKKKLDKCMKRNYYWSSREYPYKNVKPRIICEKYMMDESGTDLKDYKVFCFNGKPKYVLVDFNRDKGHNRNIYDTDWNYVPFVMNNYRPDTSVVFDKPGNLAGMLEISENMSKNHTFLRVDFYIVGDRLYLGELTFYPGTGIIVFEPPEYDALLGDMLNLMK